MEVFNLIVDEKATIWDRQYISIEAESLEEALEKYNQGDYTADESELLYDTEEFLSPSDEHPVTLEIFLEDDSGDPVLTNRKVIDYD